MMDSQVSGSHKNLSMSEHAYPASVSSGSLSTQQEGAEVKEEVIPAQHKSAFVAFLKQLATFTGDLSSLTCPAFLLSGFSLLEYSTHWGDHPDLLEAIAKAEDEVETIIAVTRWFVSTLYGSYGSRGAERKPFNPVLGEQFFGSWRPKDSGETSLVCEQVSHHPPITAFYLENKEAGVMVNGFCGQKSKFKATTVKVDQTGHIILGIVGKEDQYKITYPALYLRGMLTGSPFVELIGSCDIISTSGKFAKLEFLGKPWFSGEYHAVEGFIADKGKGDKPLFKITGKWTGETTIIDPSTGKQRQLFDAQKVKIVDMEVKPIEEQDELECRKLWYKVAQALKNQDYAQATKEKSTIEEKQRAIRKENKEKGIKWFPKFFDYVDTVEEEDNEDDVVVEDETDEPTGLWLYKTPLVDIKKLFE